MNLKKYNEQTETWDIIASGNASGISVTDPHFVNEGDIQKSVNDVLVEMDNKIELTRRNLSWVVQNGTIGGGGGGATVEALVILTNANITVVNGFNYLYATSLSVTLNYLVSEIKPNLRYYMTVELDGTAIIKDKQVYSSISGNIVIDNIALISDNLTHSIVITVTNENGISLTPYMLYIVEASLFLESYTSSTIATIGLDYYIQYTVTNKMIGAETLLFVINETTGYELPAIDIGIFSSSTPKTRNVNFFSLFPEGANLSAGSSYTIAAYATTTVDGQPIKSETVRNRVVIEDGETLVVLVDGITSSSDATTTEFDQSGSISFTFTPYLSGVNVIYYAIRMTCNGVVTDIGDNFDADDEVGFTSNPFTQRGVAKTFSWAIPQEEKYIGDYDIILRCWSEKGGSHSDFSLKCKVVKSSNTLLPTQIPNNSLYAQWHIKQASFPTSSYATNWYSSVLDYADPVSSELKEVVTDLEVKDTNGVLSGFLTTNNQGKLRLSGEAYGIIHMQPFADDPNNSSTGIYNWSTTGFTLSMTFKSDKHPYSDGTVFFIGSYDAEGELSEGIHVGLEDVVWKYLDGETKKSVSCKIQLNTVTSLDFVVDRNKQELKIFVNGVLNVAREIKSKTDTSLGYYWYSSSEMYLGCSNINGTYTNFADVEFYEINLFSNALNDFEVVVNSMNSRARASLLEDGNIDFNQYNDWKLNNMFITSGDSVGSILWSTSENDYAPSTQLNFSTFKGLKLHLPAILITCGENNGFTKEYYEKVGDTSVVDQFKGNCNFEFYDPVTQTTASTTNMSIAIQGTSSTGYRSKNIEIRFDKGRDQGVPELFQAKDTWLPENQFTLKADVVDSAHANNAAIGKWINDNADTLFEPTPPMKQFESHRPTNCGDSSRENKTFNDVTIKHTLEGFPIVLFVQFDGSSTQEMLGIYSFNLGRAAYYNMGMKFLKEYTFDIFNADNTITQVNAVPAFVTKYTEYNKAENFGSIVQSQIYSYEFGENANTTLDEDGVTVKPIALFMQDDLSVIKHVGEFKFNGGAEDPTADVTNNDVWERLQLLFTTTASMTNGNDRYIWNDVVGGYVKEGNPYTPGDFSTLGASLIKRINIKNAYSYFMICIAFGLVDSLGKNMVLRSWNVGGDKTDENYNMWWPCFYDMDTATGLSNTGNEDVAKTAYIDTFYNAEDSDGVNSLLVKSNDPNGGYDTYSSRLWDILRNNNFLATGLTEELSYPNVWTQWRKDRNIIGGNPTNGISGAQSFVDNCFAAQTAGCGELLYNFDYRVKYLTKYVGTTGEESYGNVSFLHGTRVNYVRDWLSKRLIFMDGVFKYSDPSVVYSYNESGAFACGGAETGNSELTIKTNSPVIMKITQGATDFKEYFVNENVDTTLRLTLLSSINTQIAVNNLSEISKINGLNNIRFLNFMDSMLLPSLSEIDLSNTTTLSSEPVNFAIFKKKIDGENSSDIRHIDLSNTSFLESTNSAAAFTVDISEFKKLKTLDISNSCVTSVALPNAALSELLIHNSTVTTISLVNQPFIDEVNFSGCTKLDTLVVNSCNKIKELDLRNMTNLKSVSIIGCSALEKVLLSNCTKLEIMSISNASALKELNLSGCNNSNLTISIQGTPQLTSLDLSNTTTSKPISFTAGFNSLKTLYLNSSNICAFQFGSNAIASYNDSYVLDLSPFTFDSLNIRSNSSKYIKFRNKEDEYYSVTSNTFEGCTSLIRVFGHLGLTASSCFNGCTYFTIHGKTDDDVVDSLDYSTIWNTNTYSTNITIATTSLYQAFYNTSCNLYDVYYILDRCDNVTSLQETFKGCSKVVTNLEKPLRRDTFSHCGKVATISSLFYNTNVTGPLFSPTTDTSYDGLLSPLVSVTDARAAFATGTKYIDDRFFSKVKGGQQLKLTFINSMFGHNRSGSLIIVDTCDETLTADNISSRRAYARASKLLVNLPNLESLDDVFNHIWINFDLVSYEKDGVTVSYCPLIANNTKLTSLTRCFYNVKGKGSLHYLFGGHEIFDDSKLFSRLISTINNFLTVSSYDTSPVTLNIHNSMFRQIASTLTSVSYVSVSGVESNMRNEASLNGAGINKVFKKELNDEVFPYNVFTSCKKLVNCTYFFAYLTTSTATELALPGDIFINNTNLQTIFGCFKDMNSNYRYTLTSKGFKNCKLTDVRYCFDDSNKCKKGGIPYGLFYQEKKTTKTFQGWKAGSGLSPDDVFNTGEEPTIPVITEELTIRNASIKYMDYALNKFNSTDAECYTQIFNSDMSSLEDAGDIITYNESYDPREFIKDPTWNGDEYIENPDYDENDPTTGDPTIPNPNYQPHYLKINPNYNPYHYTWNVWYEDGTPGLGDLVVETQFYKNIENGTITDIAIELPDEFFDIDHSKVSTSSTNERQISRNYICPPDLFRYCDNSSSFSATYILANTSNYTVSGSTSVRLNNGIYGRIPKLLFTPLTNATNLSYIFYNCMCITPYTWDTDEADGSMVSADTFRKNISVTNLAGIFQGLHIPIDVNIPATLLTANIKLSNIQGMFQGAIFYGDEDQLNEALFTNNKLLTNISYLFSGISSDSPSQGNGIPVISSGLFTSDKHKSITNVKGFLQHQPNTTGTVPQFWDWLNISTSNKENAFLRVSLSNIDNRDAIVVAGWDTGMIS